MGKLEIGLHQAKLLCGMPFADRLDFIAEGLPLILGSAQGLWAASRKLQDCPREANILEGHAEEEAAKILILLDIVRCPRKSIGSRVGPMVRWFYDHLARLIYANAVSWKPVDVDQLRDYVDSHRQAHFVEGEYGEFILPNWEIYSRESRLYVDVEAQEDGVRGWSVPRGLATQGMFGSAPALRTAEALSALGIFAPAGLLAVAEIWGQLEFVDRQCFDDCRRLTRTLLERLDREKLFTDIAEEKHAHLLFDAWQMPMYNLEFGLVPVSLEELQAERDSRYYAEIAGHDF
ncbi:hypothetical protein [Methylobacterium brachythecii]|uniref:Uncharacterized protein n=1 Tax=Methylobacterium brachythecii TaxID=1176177 RepID=A0A7W6F858_9HYPH|nr:hypothetical protein [Methylobacterium brachythecii]MBB3904132.1 hypothetical protein [Methylobacterium brachythecii]GLS42874.1 hypothetical protein GCM10007884_08590 [Methylobacterium brachythecii]